MYDVYNNGFDIGGKLRILFDRYLVVDHDRQLAYLSESAIQPKVARRRFFKDITFLLGVS